MNRLKDKMGTWMLPTAELTLDGTPAIPLPVFPMASRALALF